MKYLWERISAVFAKKEEIPDIGDFDLSDYAKAEDLDDVKFDVEKVNVKTDNLITTDGTHTSDTRLVIDPNSEDLEFVTSDEFDELSQNVDSATSDINGLKDKDTEQDSRLTELESHPAIDPSLERRLVNLEYAANGVLYREDVDTAEAYEKQLASDVMPYGLLDYVQGKSFVWNQMLEPNYNMSASDVAIIANNHAYEANGVSTVATSFVSIRLPNITNHKYLLKTKYISGTVEGGRLYFSSQSYGETVIGESIIIKNQSENAYWYYTFKTSAVGTKLDKYKFYISIIDLTTMFGAGNEPTLEQCKQIFTADYYPYCENTLVNKEHDAVVVRGKNLFDGNYYYAFINTARPYFNTEPRKVTSPITVENQYSGFGGYIHCKKGETYTAYCATDAYYATPFFGVYESVEKASNANNCLQVVQSKNSITVDHDGVLVIAYVNQNSNTKISFSKMQIERGTVATEYSPYNEVSTDISAIIAKYFPDGMRSAGTAHDVLDLEKGLAVRNVGSVDLEKVNWTYASNAHRTDFVIPTVSSQKVNFISDNYLFTSNLVDVVVDGNSGLAGYNTTYSLLWINTGSTDTPTGNAYYELAEPIITPIDPEDLEALRILHVEAGGSITFTDNNDGLNLPIPNQETFLVKTGGA